jgi:hypothetical protein
MYRFPLAIAAALAVAGCGGSDAKPRTVSAEPQPTILAIASVTTDSANGSLALIAEPKQRGLQQAVVFFHGPGQDAATLFADPRHARLAEALVRAGFTVASATAGGDAWGTPASLRSYRALISEFRTDGDLKVFLLAESMGGLDALRLLGSADGFAGLSTVCHLRYTLNHGPYAASINRAHRGVIPPGLSPVALTAAAASGKPVAFWASPDDTAVDETHNTDQCAAEARAAGAKVTVTATKGQGAEAADVDPAAVVAAFGG